MKPVSIEWSDSINEAEIQEAMEGACAVAFGEQKQCSGLTTMTMAKTTDAKATVK